MKKGAIFKTIRVIVILVAAVVIAQLLVKLRPEAERRVVTETGRLVEVLPAKSEKIHMYIESYGTVRPRRALRLVAEVRGKIVDIDASYEEGSFIKKGTTLIKVDPRNYQLEVNRGKVQIKQAEAEIKRLNQEVLNLKARIKIAKSDVSLAKNEYLRLKQLVDKNVIAQSTLDKTEQNYLASLERLQGLENQMALTGPQKEQLKAQRDMAKVMLQVAKLDLERASIVAPYDGWALEKTIEVGQHVTAGQYLGRIYSAGELNIEVQIPVKDFKWFPAELDPNAPPDADIIFESGGTQHIWKGRVARIKAQLEEKTRTLPVVIEVNEPLAAGTNQSTFRLRPGMFVTVKIKGREINRAFVLPRHVVYPDDVVYTVRDNHIKITPVNILRSYKESVIVDKGLSDGDLIVKTPLSSVTDGMMVRLKTDDR
ncbi:MAG: efflux RND transporter periplasmic adaptor subunit [Desulfobacteraceae bacterium]|nr:MAG: efflux RND transporter periplasmic adaptor subunit [Desulfobacteraceae bacterium]